MSHSIKLYANSILVSDQRFNTAQIALRDSVGARSGSMGDTLR